MLRIASRHTWRPRLDPLCVPARRALSEGAIGCVLLMAAGLVLASPWQLAPVQYVFSGLAGLWLLWWPAWRLRPVRGGGIISRLFKGFLRAIIVGWLLGLIWFLAATLLWPLFGGSGQALWGGHGAPAIAGAFAMPGPFIFARIVVVVAVAVGRRVRRRLRWQLTVSHLAVIVITFVMLTALGSAIGAGVVEQALRPHPPEVALSLARTVEALPSVQASNTIDRTETRVALNLITHEQLVANGSIPIGFVVRLDQTILPEQVLVLSMDGHVLAGATGANCTVNGGPAAALKPPPAATWRRLRADAVAGVRDAVPAPRPLCANPGEESPSYGAALVTGKANKALGVVVVEAAAHNAISTQNILAGAFAIFSVATIILLVLWSVPSFLIAGLFGYLLARGMTRRIESVSHVTTAIAAGDLSQRAPVNAHNEVGRLAESVNLMASNLETTLDEVQRAREKAVDALRRRQELVASISHELRTPLAIVQAHLDTLALQQPMKVGANGAWESEVTMPAETARSLQNEMDRLSALVDDLFALSRAETGALQVRRDPVDVAALVSEVAALMGPLAQREGMIALSVEAAPGLPPALADPDRLRQILSNLVRNAIRHTPDGGIIVLNVASDGPWIVVAVADTGEGIPPEHLPHIFERFYRVDQARTRSSGGAGLGLAIVREFVEAMGGRVTVESAVGEGSCFRVFLPRA